MFENVAVIAISQPKLAAAGRLKKK